VSRAAEARQKAVYHHLHRDGFSPETAPGILARVPADLDVRMERFVLEAADLFGFETAERAGRRTWYLEFGSDSLVEHLPGVSAGSRWLGTFDRGEAVEKEDLDFFASGHALVEGIFRAPVLSGQGLKDGLERIAATIEALADLEGMTAHKATARR